MRARIVLCGRRAASVRRCPPAANCGRPVLLSLLCSDITGVYTALVFFHKFYEAKSLVRNDPFVSRADRRRCSLRTPPPRPACPAVPSLCCPCS